MRKGSKEKNRDSIFIKVEKLSKYIRGSGEIECYLFFKVMSNTDFFQEGEGHCCKISELQYHNLKKGDLAQTETTFIGPKCEGRRGNLKIDLQIFNIKLSPHEL